MPRRSRNQTIENGGQTADEVKMERSSPYPSSVVRPLSSLTQRWPPSKTCATASPRPRRTQKITRAMQMVAASNRAARRRRRRRRVPMRRRWTRCSATSPPRSAGRTPRRGCCAAAAATTSTCCSSVPPNWRARTIQYRDRPARPRARHVAHRRGQGGQVLLRRPQGLRSAAPALRQADHRDGRPAVRRAR